MFDSLKCHSAKTINKITANEEKLSIKIDCIIMGCAIGVSVFSVKIDKYRTIAMANKCCQIEIFIFASKIYGLQMFIITASISCSVQVFKAYRIDSSSSIGSCHRQTHKVNIMSQHGIAYSLKRVHVSSASAHAHTYRSGAHPLFSVWRFRNEHIHRGFEIHNCWHGYDMRSSIRVSSIQFFCSQRLFLCVHFFLLVTVILIYCRTASLRSTPSTIRSQL